MLLLSALTHTGGCFAQYQTLRGGHSRSKVLVTAIRPGSPDPTWKACVLKRRAEGKKTTGLSSFRKQANCEIIEKVCQSRAGAQREPQDSQALLLSSTEPWRAAQGGNPRNSRPGKRNKKRRQEGNEQENLFSHSFSLSLLLFSSFKCVLKGPFWPYFVELHWKCSVINKILSTSSPLRWVTKTYWGWRRGVMSPAAPTYELLVLQPVPSPFNSPPRLPWVWQKETPVRVSLAFHSAFFFKVRKGFNDLTMG